MSETQTVDSTAPDEIPNFSVTDGLPLTTPGRTVAQKLVKFGSRQIEFREPDISDSWDLLEFAGPEPNDSWLNLAMLAASVTCIDGVPDVASPALSRDVIRRRLRKMGKDGVAAVARAMAELHKTSPETMDTAKN